MAQLKKKTYVIEHLDPELESWSALEYRTIAEECSEHNASFVLSSISPNLTLDDSLRSSNSLCIESKGVEDLYEKSEHQRICLLDPAAEKELSAQDGDVFDVFLFGGILGMRCISLAGSNGVD